MGTNEYSQPASKSSWDSQDFGDVNMVVKMAHFHKSSRPQWVNKQKEKCHHGLWHYEFGSQCSWIFRLLSDSLIPVIKKYIWRGL